MAKIQLSELEIDHLRTKITKIDNELNKFAAQFDIRIDVLENKIKEIENAINHAEDDYYNIKKEILGKLNDLDPHIKEMKNLKNEKEKIKKDIESLKKSIQKILIILSRLNERISLIEEELHIK